jgi:WhiB family redox-sensing transcriptional regulator
MAGKAPHEVITEGESVEYKAHDATPHDCPDVSILGQRPAWQRRAPCRGRGCDWWFPTSREADEAARAVCEPCPVRRECLAYAMADRELVGIWAGTDAAERRRLRRVSA